jgi:putative DNA primase/helicase
MIDNIEGTRGTEGTIATDVACSGSPDIIVKGTEGTTEINLEPISPLDEPPDQLNKPVIERTSYQTHDDWFQIGEEKLQPGLYYHGLDNKDPPGRVDIWICSPIHAEALTCNEHGVGWGILLRFCNPDGKWREWAMPRHMLKGLGEEMRGELLHMGVSISPTGNKLLHSWLASRHPKKRIIAATRTGWHVDGRAFVLANTTIGDDQVRFQSEYAVHDDFTHQGDLNDWRKFVGLKCKGNPILILSVSVAFAGPLLLKAKQQSAGGGGIHLVGKSSNGKTTALQVAASVWGGHDYVRTWRATANGLEATAAALNDCLLVLDEISECDSREIGAIVYALANGQGKQRAKRTGGSRESARWRVFVLSSGERSLSAHMQESGQSIKAGQEARLLNTPATERTHGAFDNLHGLSDGRAFADDLKQSTSRYYGVTGPAFIEKLLADSDCLHELYAKTNKLPSFSTSDGVEGRAASMFALIAISGEKATEYGLTGWAEGEALDACIELFDAWRDFRGQGQTETRQILQATRYFIERHGDSRFSELKKGSTTDNNSIDQRPIVHDRAGYWRDIEIGRVFMFNSTALQEAVSGYDLKSILSSLKDAGWLVDNDKGKNSKKTKVEGRSIPLYWIMPTDEAA